MFVEVTSAGRSTSDPLQHFPWSVREETLQRTPYICRVCLPACDESRTDKWNSIKFDTAEFYFTFSTYPIFG